MKAPEGMYFRCGKCGNEEIECDEHLLNESNSGVWTPVCSKCNSKVMLFRNEWDQETKQRMIDVIER